MCRLMTVESLELPTKCIQLQRTHEKFSVFITFPSNHCLTESIISTCCNEKIQRKILILLSMDWVFYFVRDLWPWGMVDHFQSNTEIHSLIHNYNTIQEVSNEGQRSWRVGKGSSTWIAISEPNLFAGIRLYANRVSKTKSESFCLLPPIFASKTLVFTMCWYYC